MSYISDLIISYRAAFEDANKIAAPEITYSRGWITIVDRGIVVKTRASKLAQMRDGLRLYAEQRA